LFAKQKVFGLIARTPEGVKPIEYIWILSKNKIRMMNIRYKAWLVAQVFSQKPNIDL